MKNKEFERSKKFSTINAVEYSEGAVVSKTITNRKEGTVTLFAFDKEQGLSEHTAPYDAQVHILDGKANILINGKPNLLGTGEAIIMPAGIPHAIEASERFKMLLTMIKSDPS